MRKTTETCRLWWATADRCARLRISPPDISRSREEIASTCQALGWADLADGWREAR